VNNLTEALRLINEELDSIPRDAEDHSHLLVAARHIRAAAEYQKRSADKAERLAATGED
jgi:hypothetical protein